MSQQVRYRFGEFEFNPETGELHPGETATEQSSVAAHALSPQPAQLLGLLLDKDGELLSRDEIRAELWPDTHIDFDSSLHFCIRKIRSALGDDADAERYIETLPRRGYRMAVPVETLLVEDKTEQPATGKGGRRASGKIQLLLWALSIPIGLLGGTLLALLVTQARQGHMEERDRDSRPVTELVQDKNRGPLRLAILPFEVGIQDPRTATRSARLSEGLTAALTQSFNDEAQHTRDRVVRVLGPLSTAPYRELPFPKLDELRNDLAIDLVLNARIVEGGEGNGPEVEGILVELIDTATRAHLWADFYPLTTDWLRIEAPITDGVSRAIASLSESSDDGGS